MNKFLVGLAAAASLSSGAASAATFTFAPGMGDILPTENVLYSFNDPANDGVVTGSNYLFLTNSSGNGAVPAAGDGSRYLSVLGGGTASIDFGGSGASGFSIDIGSVDSYNTLTLNFLDGTSQSFTGSQLVLDPNGNQSSAQTNGRFRFTATGDERITGITLTSSTNSFEVDRIAVAAVPEPTTWALMIGGFGLVGAAMRRRAKVQVAHA